ncbi:MAG: 1-acyl-sn-glycerol-3-phosphate acyltransferase [Clostridia bacterium]|nr:1-acyl-sn-glycerol-3-phosphate acyltransferase [Clostridia bacterium]
MKKKKVYFYHTYEDEILQNNTCPPIIDEKYRYLPRNFFVKLWSWFYYRIIIFPIGWLYCKIKRIKYVGLDKIRKCKTGYFVYANHTHQFGDVFSPSMLTPTRKPYLVVNPQNLNIPVLGSSTKYLGAMPLPQGIGAHKNFLNAIEYRLKQKHGIIIYPEAKLWPYYTQIRPYDDTAFRYPIKYMVPTFCVTTTYQTQKNGKCRIIVYVDGPYNFDKNLSAKQNQAQLYQKVKTTMQDRARKSDFKVCEYVRIEEKIHD